MLFWTITLRAFFSSKRFFTVHMLALLGIVPLIPGAPVSMNSVVDTTQNWPSEPGVRPNTQYSDAPVTACHRTRTAPPPVVVTVTSAEVVEVAVEVWSNRLAATRYP